MEENEPTFFEALALLEEMFHSYCLPPSVYLKRNEISDKQKQIINLLFSKVEKMLIEEKSTLDKLKKLHKEEISILDLPLEQTPGIKYRMKGSAIVGEFGLFFDDDPDIFIKNVIEHGLADCETSFEFGICTGEGKHQVSTEYSYWNYYLPKKSIDQLNIDPKHWVLEEKWQKFGLS